MGISLLAGLLLAYNGMVALCLGLERHYRQVWQRVPGAGWRQVLRGLGWLALLASLGASVAAWGWAMGPIAWLGLVSMAGLALVLLLPYWPRAAVAVAAGAWLVLGVALLV
ncbi:MULTISPECIES: DUF3325 domain-containing protein [unclassified Pseudomonas]|uniref:DUF3325 domain-containing protein n=1 Tax=unclassified Pseudomonas TaxID=196821 RepID=UPI0035C20F02